MSDYKQCRECIKQDTCTFKILKSKEIDCQYFIDKDVVPRSEYDDLKMQFTELDIECNRLEKVEQKFDDYKKFVGEIRVTSENHAVIIDTEHTEYIDKRVAEGLKNLAVKQAKQEVAREILNAFTSFRALSPKFCKVYNEIEKKYIGG